MANLDRDFYLDKHGLQSFVGEFETNIIAEEYNTSSAYAVGDYCIYENLFYRCTTAIPSGESWDPSHWTQVLIGDELVGLNQEATTTTSGLMSATDKVKLDGIESGAEVNVQSDWNATSGDALILNKPTIPAAQVNSDWNAVSGVAQILNKPTIPAAQVNSDWSASSGVAEILNKPTTISGYGITDAKIASGTITLGSNTITPLTQHQSVTDNNPTLSWGTKSKVATIGSTEINVTMPTNPNTNTTYTFADGTNGFTVTPSDGTAQTVTVTPDLQLEGSASGSIASFNDGGDNIPLKSLIANITARQASGTPSPSNPLPITGFSSVNVAVSSKNLWGNGNVSFTGNVFEVPLFQPLPPATYTISATVTSTDTHATTCAMIVYYTDGTSSSTLQFNRNTRNSKLLNVSKTIEIIAFYTSDSWAHGTGDTATWADIQIEVSSTMTDYEAPQVHTVSLGQTIYGGVLDVTNGVLRVNYGFADMGDLNYVYNGGYFKTASLNSVIARPASSNVYPDAICSVYPAQQWRITDNLVFWVVPKQVAQDPLVWFADNNYNNADTFKAAVTGQQFVYKLATPITINLTKTQVTTLLNENNIYADSGDISVEYFTQSAKDISDVANSSNKMDYSNPTGIGSLSIGRKAGTKIGGGSVATGTGATASGAYSFATGYNTTASNDEAFAEGSGTIASGQYGSHAEGLRSEASGSSSHAEGYETKAVGAYAHAEGNTTTVNGANSHAEGYGNTVNGINSHAEGSGNTIDILEGQTSNGSHVEGLNNTASGTAAHAEGRSNTITNANYGHAEGYNNTITGGGGSHAEGSGNTASGQFSHCEGQGTKTTHRSQHVFGEYNLADTSTATFDKRGTYIEIVGKGSNNANRSNARTLDWSGNETLAGDLTIKGNVSVGDAITLNTSGTASRRITDITVIRSKIVNFNGIKFFNATIRADADVLGGTGILDVSTGFGASGQQSLLVTASTGGTIQAYIQGTIITTTNASALVSGTVYYIIGWYI